MLNRNITYSYLFLLIKDLFRFKTSWMTLWFFYFLLFFILFLIFNSRNLTFWVMADTTISFLRIFVKRWSTSTFEVSCSLANVFSLLCQRRNRLSFAITNRDIYIVFMSHISLVIGCLFILSWCLLSCQTLPTERNLKLTLVIT